MAFTLLGTEDCHLCDVAKSIVVEVMSGLSVEVYLEDIAESTELVERYGTKIPVFRHDASGQELEWPFDQARLQQWLNSMLNDSN
ncbi:MAG: glutaredoxin family protein [Oceanobacter sp.]|jgi:hypothetical protein